MELSEGLELWLGPLIPPPQLDPPRRLAQDARALYLGAGFTRATNGSAPLFNSYRPALWEAIKACSTVPDWILRKLQDDENNLSKDEWREATQVTELAEIYHNYAGRRAVAELFMSEPVGESNALPALAPGAYRDWDTPLPPRSEATYRSFRHWQKVVEVHYPLHLSVLHPGKAPVMVGRLLAEGFISEVLSTNWDSYVELGAWLVGLEVLNARDPLQPDTGRQTLQVFDSGRDVSLYSRRSHEPLLLKLHSGIDVVTRVMDQVSKGWISEAQAEQQLRACFLVSSTDLTHWRDATQWVQDVVSDSLRSHRVFFVGVSGADAVTFRAVRCRVIEWEQAARDAELEQRHRPQRKRDPEHDPLPLFGVTWRPEIRKACMLSVQQPKGSPNIHVKHGDGKFALRATYAWGMLRRILTYLEPDLPTQVQLAGALSNRLRIEIDAAKEETSPLLNLLCDALGPNARWAALAEGRPPFETAPLDPAARWWYAPWFQHHNGAAPLSRKALQQLAACAAWLTRPQPDQSGKPFDPIRVDPWTGVVQLPAWELQDHHFPPHSEPLTACDLLLLPWPWEARAGVLSTSLHAGLKRSLHWLPGRSLDWLASPRLYILPVGAREDTALELPPLFQRHETQRKHRDHLRRELPLAAGWSRLLDPIDWLNVMAIEGTPDAP